MTITSRSNSPISLRRVRTGSEGRVKTSRLSISQAMPVSSLALNQKTSMESHLPKALLPQLMRSSIEASTSMYPLMLATSAKMLTSIAS